MRYSKLVYLSKMCRTLQEAVQYLRTIPGQKVAEELLINGAQMLDQIWEMLETHKADLRSPLLMDRFAEIERDWQTQGAELEAELGRFIQYLPQEVSYQVRAVFFTGLGSTWDAMESVYQYMQNDPRFDPVVVLIPVFRQVQQGGQSRQEVTYTDYLTPMGIPFYEYDHYSLGDDCPDLAFTNQPYESTVLREFWPETIAAQTRLVYLPYFVPFSIYEAAKTAMCKLPVYRYAWKTVGQSQRHYEYYCKHADNGGGNMLLTGVPKWDPIVRLAAEPVQVPKPWESAVSGRRVFLWNSFYDFSGSSIPYFDSIYQWFVEHQDCALIWRAHPMTETVTKLYYPLEYYQCFQKYLAMTDAAPNMVFDREVSFGAAFCCSCAQISDLSSMMFQYLPLDKPVLYIETSGRGKVEEEFIIDSCWMHRAHNAADILNFLDAVYAGIDDTRELRELVRQRDIPLADGKCGERLCENLWDLMHREDGLQ